MLASCGTLITQAAGQPDAHRSQLADGDRHSTAEMAAWTAGAGFPAARVNRKTRTGVQVQNLKHSKQCTKLVPSMKRQLAFNLILVCCFKTLMF